MMSVKQKNHLKIHKGANQNHLVHLTLCLLVFSADRLSGFSLDFFICGTSCPLRFRI